MKRLMDILVLLTLFPCHLSCDRQKEEEVVNPEVVAARQQRERTEERRLEHFKAIGLLRDELLRTEISATSAKTSEEFRLSVDALVFAYTKVAETWSERSDNAAVLAAAAATKSFREILGLWEDESEPYRSAVVPALRPPGSDAELAEIGRKLEWSRGRTRAATARVQKLDGAIEQSKHARAVLDKASKE